MTDVEGATALRRKRWCSVLRSEEGCRFAWYIACACTLSACFGSCMLFVAVCGSWCLQTRWEPQGLGCAVGVLGDARRSMAVVAYYNENRFAQKSRR